MQQGTWIPEDQRDSRYHIWYSQFRVRMRYADTISMEDLQRFGIITSGDRTIDRQNMNDDVILYLSINQMVEYFRQGTPLSVCDYKDTVKIYDYITAHLDAMRAEIAAAFSLKNIPFDDLVLLDDFANVVYDKAAPQFTRADANNFIANKMADALPFSFDNILGRGSDEAKQVETAEEETMPAREGLGNYFTAVAKRQRSRAG